MPDAPPTTSGAPGCRSLLRTRAGGPLTSPGNQSGEGRARPVFATGRVETSRHLLLRAGDGANKAALL